MSPTYAGECPLQKLRRNIWNYPCADFLDFCNQRRNFFDSFLQWYVYRKSPSFCVGYHDLEFRSVRITDQPSPPDHGEVTPLCLPGEPRFSDRYSESLKPTAQLGHPWLLQPQGLRS